MQTIFSFFLNQIEFDIETPYEITPNHFIRKATIKEIEIISKYLAKSTDEFFLNLYKSKIINTTGTQWSYEFIKKHEEWRFWVVESKEENNKNLRYLRYALMLCEHDLKLEFDFIIQEGRSMGFISSQVGRRFFEGEIGNSIIRVDMEIVKKIQYNYELVMQSQSEVGEKCLRAFYEISAMSAYSPLRILAYFIIWELLLAHKPDPKDPGDSITRQLRSKVNLINNRMLEKIDLTKFVGDLGLEKVVSKLYSYRSTIVHGDEPDFKKGELQVLNGRMTTENILREITRKLIMQSLLEPDLFKDLKEC